MGEDQPLQIPGELPPEEQQQPQQIEVTTPDEQQADLVAEQTEEPSQELEHKVNHDEDDGRWDHQKAETMAAVLDSEAHGRYNLGEPFISGAVREHYQGLGDSIDEQKKLEHDPDRTGDKTQEALQRKMIEIQQRRSFLEGSSDLMTQEELAEKKAGLAAAERDYDYAASHKLETQRKFHEKLGKRFEEVTDRYLSPYVELYDSDPEKFASMPTSEFMKVGREYEHISEVIRKSKESKPRLESALTKLNKCLEDAEEPDEWVVYDIPGMVNGALGLFDKEAQDAFRSEWDQISANSFEKSPRQIVEALWDLAHKKLEEANSYIPKLVKRRQELLGTKDSSVDQPASSS